MPKSHDNDTWKSVNNLKLIPPSLYNLCLHTKRVLHPETDSCKDTLGMLQPEDDIISASTTSLRKFTAQIGIAVLSTMGIKVLYFKIVKKKLLARSPRIESFKVQ